MSQPDHHLLVDGDVLRLTKGPTENSHRPAVNALFRSAAIAAGPRVVGVVLSGVRDDGARGLRVIADRGGVTVVQDPADALHPGMPSSALSMVDADHVVPVDVLADTLTKITGEIMEFPAVPSPSNDVVLEDRIARDGMHKSLASTGPGTHTQVFSCPDCDGVLVEIAPDTGAYRCLIGHAWTQEALLAEQGAELQRAMMTALRGLEERAVLADRMQRGAQERGQHMLRERYTATSRESSAAAEVLRRFLQSADMTSATSTTATGA